MRYYWTTYQTEWATDAVFRRAVVLRRLTPRLVHYGLTVLQSPDIRRFLARPVRLDGEVPKRFRGEVVTDLKVREEGARIKHSVDGNSVKAYDKGVHGYRDHVPAEATMQRTYGFRVYRRNEGNRTGKRRGGCCCGVGAGRGLSNGLAREPYDRRKKAAAAFLPSIGF